MPSRVALLLSSVAFVPPGAIALWAQAQPREAMTGGGQVSLRRDGDTLHVTVNGPRKGLASLCVGDQWTVRILHASAALGEARYEKQGDSWTLASGFEFKLRDSRTGPPSDADRRGYFETMGWSANSSNAGAPVREFAIRLTDRIRFIGVAFLGIDEPMAVSHWPSSLDDDCRAVQVAQGYLPKSARFTPSAWHSVR
jgi:hypothetical protein